MRSLLFAGLLMAGCATQPEPTFVLPTLTVTPDQPTAVEKMDSIVQDIKEIEYLSSEEQGMLFVDCKIAIYPDRAFLISEGDTIARFTSDGYYLYKDGYKYDIVEDNGQLYLGRVDTIGGEEYYFLYINGM